jgi:serine protease Do
MKKLFVFGLLACFLLTGCSSSVPAIGLPAVHAASDAAPASPAAGTSGQIPDPVMLEMQDAYIRLTEHIRPFVVNIDTEGTTPREEVDMRQFDELFRFFGMPFGPDSRHAPKQKRMALGSGFIFDKEGHIITNNHMVEGAEKINVKLSTGKEYEAKVVGRDPDTDLAVIKIDPEGDLPAASLGDSDQLKAGEFTIACGSPRGFEGSFTFGHVSALGRNQLDLPGLRFQNFIQTDAAINLGNSGGPLCNLKGEVVGINVAIVYGANALGFAIPVNTAKQVIPTLIGKGKITRGFLGVGITDVREFIDAVGLPDSKGAFVKTVQPGGAAEQAGIKPYDVIRKVDGTEVANSTSLIQLISNVQPGHTAKLEIWRDKKATEIEVKVGEYLGR